MTEKYNCKHPDFSEWKETNDDVWDYLFIGILILLFIFYFLFF